MARQDKAVVAKQAGGEADRHRPCSKNRPAGEADWHRPCSRTGRQVKLAGLLSCSRRLVEGVRWCWPLGRWAQTYPTVSLPTYRLCLSLSIPTPLVYKNPNLAPTYFFVLFYFYFPYYNFVSLTPVIVSVRLTYHVS